MIQPDKRLHFFCTFLMNISLLFIFYLFEVSYGVLKANTITALFWIGKEVWDCYKPTTTRIAWLDNFLRPLALIGTRSGFSFSDLLADAIGMIVANGTYMLLIA